MLLPYSLDSIEPFDVPALEWIWIFSWSPLRRVDLGLTFPLPAPLYIGLPTGVGHRRAQLEEDVSDDSTSTPHRFRHPRHSGPRRVHDSR